MRPLGKAFRAREVVRAHQSRARDASRRDQSEFRPGCGSGDLEESATALIRRAALRVGTSAEAAFKGGDVEGAYVAAYDAYRMAAECLLARQGLRATGGDGSHMTVEDAETWNDGTAVTVSLA